MRAGIRGGKDEGEGGEDGPPLGTVGAVASSAESAADAPTPAASTRIGQTLCGGVSAGRQYSMTGDDRARGTASRGVARQSALLEAPACKVDNPLMQDGFYVAIC